MFVHGCVERPARALRAAIYLLLCANLTAPAAPALSASLEPVEPAADPAPAPAPVKQPAPFNAATHFPLVPGSSWRYTVEVDPPQLVRVTVEDDTRRVNGVATRTLRLSPGNNADNYTADEDGLRLHQVSLGEGGTLTYDPPMVVVEPGAWPGEARRRTGRVDIVVGRQRAQINYDTRSEVIGTETVTVGGRVETALHVQLDVELYGVINNGAVFVAARLDRWLVPELGVAHERETGQNGAFTTRLDFAFVDTDGDRVSVLEDNCRATRNADQSDADADGAGDACDRDDDNDGTPDATDAFPTNPREQADTDRDGAGNNADLDDDNDGLPDAYEQRFRLDPLSADDARIDSDGDGLDNLTEFARSRNPQVNEVALLPILLDMLLD